jgi:hypothetical protein
VNGYTAIAAELQAITEWVETELAAGQPCKYLLQQAVLAIRTVEASARLLADLNQRHDRG